MSCHIVIPDFEAHHQEIEVQTQNMKIIELNTYVDTKFCK